MINILIICTGNICRSPYAERLLQHYLDRVNPDTFSITSAGIQALVGSPMEATAAYQLEKSGGNAQGFAARQMYPDTLEAADMVLTMTEEQRTEAVSRSAKIMKRVFTVREFAAVLEEIKLDPMLHLPCGNGENTTHRWNAVRNNGALKRFVAKKRLGGKLDVADPYRRGDAAFTTMVDELKPALQAISAFEESHL